MTKIETALTFENPEDESALQIEMDTNGYSLTIFDADGSVASMAMDKAAIGRLSQFIFTITLDPTPNKETTK